MISVADLVAENRLPGNYFASDVYVRGTLEFGLLENRRGNRLLALPETLIKGIYAGLEQETGQASKLVLLNCGRWWGKNFYARFCDELSDFYKRPLADLTMAEFLQALQQCWHTHGWGGINLDPAYQSKGFLGIQIFSSPYAQYAPPSQQPVCYLEAGILQAFFGQLTGRELSCVQLTCEALGADYNYFVLGLEHRLKPAAAMVAAGKSYTEVMAALSQQS
ncbi:MAG: 4-vinyl reductase [Leptolyngbyaceae cyanobacterium SM1_1_3]|nr:4-vinyl reductase [Leptolyngbyaceae cyanobacterium SM1_1_3]NJN03355.1 4-vinyl reductase [Leptolyngbyaceae cyanobacterium RM1_1_2]NJO09883.1 4-vinyl reductase [Leptolyngbyaceae cyanobacterium SL_1_1]